MTSRQTHFETAGGIVLNPEGKVLLVTNQIGTITFPKGTLEAGETYEEAAVREVLEESGLRSVNLVRVLGSISRAGFKTENGHTRPVTKHIRMFLLRTEEVELSPNVEDKDILEVNWVDPQDVLDLLSWPEEAEFYNDHESRLTSQ